MNAEKRRTPDARPLLRKSPLVDARLATGLALMGASLLWIPYYKEVSSTFTSGVASCVAFPASYLAGILLLLRSGARMFEPEEKRQSIKAAGQSPRAAGAQRV